MPNSVEYIGDEAFLSCRKLNKVTIPKGVKQIGEKAFGYNYVSSYFPDPRIYIKIECYNNTEGQKYAIENEIDYELIYDAPATKVLLLYPYIEGEPAPLLSNLVYTVFGSQSQIVRSATADANGNIDLSGLTEGEYIVELELDGFAPRKLEYKTGETLGEIKLCKYGDCTGDGEIDTEDIARMQQKISEWNVSYVYDETADLNCDGEMDTEDLAMLQQFISGWNVKPGQKKNA